MIQPEVHVSYAVKDKQGRRFLTTHRDYDYSVTVINPSTRTHVTVINL